MDNPTSFQQLVDDAIKSASSSMLRDSSIRSFSSIIDSAIKSTSTSSSTGLDRIFRRLGLSGPEDFEITPPPSQHHHLASSPSNTLNSDESKSSQSGTDTKIESRILKTGPTPPIPVSAQIFKFRELAVATNNFSPECLLEVGEFSRLYRGRLESTGQVVAVKQFDQNDLQENWEFWVEILMHHLLHHPNLVKLIGYCVDGGRRLLVYEFMPLGSLEDHLFEMRRNPVAGDTCMSSHTVADDLHMKKLLYLENRFAFARLFFPSEAKLAMDIAHAETTSEFAGLSASKGSNGNLREVDLNETPIVQNKRLLSRIEALMKTVEMGRRYFPHCSEVLDKFMEDDLPDLFYVEKGTQEEQRIKRTRFMELKDDVHKAFSKDKAELSRSGISS